MKQSVTGNPPETASPHRHRGDVTRHGCVCFSVCVCVCASKCSLSARLTEMDVTDGSSPDGLFPPGPPEGHALSSNSRPALSVCLSDLVLSVCWSVGLSVCLQSVCLL